MSLPATTELFIIGNELLIGEIRDSNSHWLCREIHSLGGRVTRATILRDELDVIASELRSALGRGPRLIITSGGLGPTADDMTLVAVALGTGCQLGLNQTALAMIRQRYDELTSRGVLGEGGINPAREKMAWLPAGAVPLENPVGTAPGVLLGHGETTIVCLPGVPSELEGIFATSLQPLLGSIFAAGLSRLRTITVSCNDESIMEPVLSSVSRDHPLVYIKSLATTIDETREIDIRLTASGDVEAEVCVMLEAAVSDLQDGLSGLGLANWERIDSE